MSGLTCPGCGSGDVTLPHELDPENDAACNSCGLCFGPRAPFGSGMAPEDVAAFVALRPLSEPYFKEYLERIT